MAGPSVMVRVLGDVSGLGNSFKQAGTHAESAASKARAAFSGLLSQLNQTGVLGPFGEALSIVDEGMAGLIEHGKKVSDVMVGAGGTLAGVGVLASQLGSKEQAAHQQLAAAIAATGGSYDQYGKAVDEAIKHNEKYGQSSVATQNALQILTAATHNPTEALKLLGETTDLAAAKHESLSQAADDMGKVYNGNTKLLKEFGVTVNKNTGLTKDHQTATQALANIVKGQAAAATDTFTGKLDVLKTKIEDHVSMLGEKYGPALQGVGAGMTAVGTAIKITQGITEAFTGVQKGATAATEAMTGAEDAAAVSEGLALGPILLIVAAVAALIAIGYVIYRNWNTIWAGIKAIVKDVWDWIRTNWPLLLTIIMGPIGLAAAEVIKHWKNIKQAAVGVWNWIVNTWNTIEAFITKPFTDAETTITNVWANVTSFFQGLPGDIAGFFSGLANTILSPFKTAFDDIANLWNNTVGKVSFKIPSWVPGIGGHGFSMPKIPTFETGGIMPYTGLALVHAGETITPAGAAGPRGPAVHIEHATFSREVDVDLLMKRVAWMARTQKM